MAKMFQCPACGKQYPALPTLVDRPVRCSGCREIFRLGHDGVAVLVSPDDLAPATATKPAAAAAAPPAAQAAAASPRPPAPAPPTTPPADAPATGRPQTRVFRRKHEALKQSLSAAAAAAAGTVDDDTATATDAPRKATSSRRAAAQPRTAASGTASAGFQPTRVRREGSGLLVPAIALGALLLVVITGWWLLRPGPIDQAFDRFLADVGDGNRSYPTRHQTYLERTWLRTIDGTRESEIALDADQARLGPELRVPLETVRSVVETLRCMVQDRRLALWLQPERAEEAQTIAAASPPSGGRAAILDALEDAGIRHIDYTVVPGALHDLGLGAIEVQALSALLAGTPSDTHPLESPNARALELRWFSRADGSLLMNDGVAYTIADEQAYWGLLLRVDGVTPTPWRVLFIRRGTLAETTGSDRHNPLMRAARAHEDRLRSRAAELAAAPEEEL